MAHWKLDRLETIRRLKTIYSLETIQLTTDHRTRANSCSPCQSWLRRSPTLRSSSLSWRRATAPPLTCPRWAFTPWQALRGFVRARVAFMGSGQQWAMVCKQSIERQNPSAHSFSPADFSLPRKSCPQTCPGGGARAAGHEGGNAELLSVLGVCQLMCTKDKCTLFCGRQKLQPMTRAGPWL